MRSSFTAFSPARKRSIGCVFGAIVISACAASALAQPGRYQAIEIEYEHPNLRGVYATDLNDHGVIVGVISVTGEGTSGFAHYDNQYHELLGPNGTIFSPEGVNNLSEIVGNASPDFFEPTHAMVISGTDVFDLGALEGSSSYGYAISHTGFIVGRAHDGEGEWEWSSDYGACAFDDNGIDFLGYLGFGMDSAAFDVNDFGVSVGSSSVNRYFQYPRKAFVSFGGYMFALEDFGQDSNFAFAINNSNTVVGTCERTNQYALAVAWENGFILNSLGTIGGNHSSASDVNDDGIIVGSSGVIPSQNDEAFVCQGNIMYNVNDLLVGSVDVRINEAVAINGNGEIAARVHVGEIPNTVTQLHLLTPEDNPTEVLVLERVENGLVGANTFWISNVTENEAVFLAYGLQRGSLNVPGCRGLRTDIRPVLGVIESIGRSGGEAFFPISVPEAAANRSIIFQAFEPSSCRKSVPGYVWFDG